MATLQSRLQTLLGGPNKGGFPIPNLDAATGRKLLARIDSLSWHLNRYSLELNFSFGRLGVDDFLSMARDWGFDGAQLHLTRHGPRVGLSGESDQYLAALAAQEGEHRRLEISLDTSTIEAADLNDAARVARAMGVRTVRCYSSTGGTIKEIISTAIERLKYAADLAAKWDLRFLFEQHERLTGPEIVEIVEGVDAGDLVAALFDFGNPIPAGRNPLDDLYEMRHIIKGAHSKDMIILPEAEGQSCIGVEFGSGDLPLAKIYFDLLMLGDDHPQVDFVAVQSVLGYIASASRLRSDSKDRIFESKGGSETPVPSIHRDARLLREREDARNHFESAKLIVKQLGALATEAVCADADQRQLGPEATRIREIENIGRQLYGDSNAKRIWKHLRSGESAGPEGSTLDPKETEALLTVATEKHKELLEGCV